MKKICFKKVTAFSSAAVLLTLSVAGCASGDDGSQRSDSSSSKTELTVWTRDSTVEAVKSAAEKYNESQDDVTISVVEQPASQMADQLSLALSSSAAPDIVSLDCTRYLG